MKYNQLGKTGVLVSELCLGTMTFGGRGFWEAIGRLQQDEVNGIVKTAIDHGINFIDTADGYSEGLSEKLLGASLKSLGINRQHIFIATKLRIRMGQDVNQVGLTRHHIAYAVDDSLERLGLSHIDLLYIHGIDPVTPLEETMRGLEEVVRAGKVRYIGISNHPAWMVVKANAIADGMGWNQFCASQNYYSIAGRDIERDILPMAISEGISIIPWSPLAGGFLSGKYTRDINTAGDSRRDSFDFPPIDKEKAYDIIDVLIRIGRENSVSAARVALAWMRQKEGISSILIGAKNVDQLTDNIASTTLNLNPEEMEQLDDISQITPEYPGWMMERQMEDRADI